MNLDRIMSNIYGPGATQNFDNITGGRRRNRNRIPRKSPKVKYLDVGNKKLTVNQNTKERISFTNEFRDFSFRSSSLQRPFYGGAAKSISDHVYPSALYIPDTSIEEFATTFLLKYLFSHAHKNSIFLIPPPKEFQRLKKDFEDKLKAEKIPLCTPEASKYAAKTPLLFKAYILDVYGENENDGQPYHVDPEQISSNEIKVVQRTSRLGTKYNVETGKGKIYIYPVGKANEKVECTGVGVAAGNVIVAKCDLSKFNIDIAHNSNIITSSFTGGNAKKLLRNAFLNLVHKYDDVDRASYEFIAAIGDANKNRLNELADYYSGNYVHTAFSILADGKNFNINNNPSTYNSHAIHSALINRYKPKRSVVNINKSKEVIGNIIRQSSKQGSNANKSFINMLNKMYETTSAPKYMLKADIATAACEACDSTLGPETAFASMDEIDELENDTGKGVNGFAGLAMSGGSRREGASTAFINMIGGNLLRNPFAGHLARENVPMLYESKISNKAFDDTIAHDKESTSMFQYLNNDMEAEGEGSLDVTNDEPSKPPESQESPKPQPKPQPETSTETVENEGTTNANHSKKQNQIDISTFF